MSEYSLYLAIGAVVIAAIIGGYVWQQGLLGTASEERIKKILGRLSVQTEHWEQELTDRIAERKAKEAATTPTLTKAVSNIESIKAAHAMLENKIITPAQFEKMRDDIMGVK